jgi:hypothetical protein
MKNYTKDCVFLYLLRVLAVYPMVYFVNTPSRGWNGPQRLMGWGGQSVPPIGLL